MKATQDVQLRLLDLQATDTTRAQLAHRRATLPELAELDRLSIQTDEAAAAVAQVSTKLDGLDQHIRALEREVDSVRTRARRDQERMDAGTVSSAKELSSMQHEVQTLASKQRDLEDRELELMEQREAVDAEVSAASRQLDQLSRAHALTVERRDTSYVEIDADDAAALVLHDQLVAQLPAELVAKYEQLRVRNAGVGAAALRARRCQGCQLELFGTALAQLHSAPEEEVVYCEECGRILVRTAQSGL